MTNEINVNNLSEMINDKMDNDMGNLPQNIDYVVEWKSPTSSDPSWYRLYKSGWCEQGGYIPITSSYGEQTVTLLKVMRDNQYLINFNCHNYNSSSSATYYQVGCWNITTTGFTCRNDNVLIKCWEVKGFIAQS